MVASCMERFQKLFVWWTQKLQREDYWPCRVWVFLLWFSISTTDIDQNAMTFWKCKQGRIQPEEFTNLYWQKCQSRHNSSVKIFNPQISMELPYYVLRKSSLKFTKGSRRENSISSTKNPAASCLSEQTLWKVQFLGP